MNCSEASAAALEPLAGTATQARRWLLVEVREAWGRDVVPESTLPGPVKERLAAWAAEHGGDGRVLFIRKPERRGASPTVVFVAEVFEHGGMFRRLELADVAELEVADLRPGAPGKPVTMPTLLVCTHGRRDACCAAKGVPVYEALRGFVEPDALWQCSHLGGHRFAGNVLALPHGIVLGRVRPVDAPRIAVQLAAGTVPLAHFRGRVVHESAAQAAELAIRERLAVAHLTALRYLGRTSEGRHRFTTPIGEVQLGMDEVAGPTVPPSCGLEPERTTSYLPRWHDSVFRT